MIDPWTTPALSAYFAAAVLIEHGRITAPTDRDLEFTSMAEWLDGTDVSVTEIAAALAECRAMPPQDCAAMLARVYLQRRLH